jgi:hypothetical protein
LPVSRLYLPSVLYVHPDFSSEALSLVQDTFAVMLLVVAGIVLHVAQVK